MPDDARATLLRGGHCPHDENPEEFTAELVAFLKSEAAKPEPVAVAARAAT